MIFIAKNKIMKEFKYSELTEKIIGCAMRVHSSLGNGFQEVIYQRALDIEMFDNGLKFGREISIPVYFKNQQIGERRVDFLVENIICVELKSIIQLENLHMAQAKNYLEAFNLEVGLLLNFGSRSLEIKRIKNSKSNESLKSL
jgi:GxxExxY protein